MSVLPENWHPWYIGGAYSESRIRISKCRPQNPFLGKFRSKKSKLSVLPENWHTWYLGRTDSASGLSFFKIPTAKSIFEQIWAEKVKVVRFAWKLAHKVFRRCWFLIRLNFQLEIHFLLGPGSGIACFVWCWFTYRGCWFVSVKICNWRR